MLPPEAASPTTSNRSGREPITSSVWVPMDPVEPSRTILRTKTVCHDAPTVSRNDVAGPSPVGWRPGDVAMSQTSPNACMAFATLMKPVMLAPTT